MTEPEIHSDLGASLRERLQPLSRRTFLAGAVSGAAWLAACSSNPPSGSAPHALDETERALFDKLVAVFLPTAGTPLTPPSQVPLYANIESLLGVLPKDVRRDFGIGLLLFEWGPWVVGFHFARFSKLSDEAAHAYCAQWQSGNVVQRGVFGALKQIIYMSYWRNAATWAPIGYEGPVSARLQIPRVGNAPLPVE